MVSDGEEKDERVEPAAAVPLDGGPAGDADGDAPQVSWEADLDVYPVRESSEDPGWATKIVWGWVCFVLASIGFIMTLLVLGAYHD